jgi:amidophosphoribosyltransferase
MEDIMHEKCAVVGVSLTTGEAAGVVYNGLLALQHRGQEGAGIAAVRENKIIAKKGLGLVGEVFSGGALTKLSDAKTAVGHARYSTTGESSERNVAPFITEYLTGRLATAHNGNVTNDRALRDRLEGFGVNFDATSDSEVVSALIAYEITRAGDAIAGVMKAAEALEGAFSLIIALNDARLIAVRDKNGYRPLCLGRGANGAAFASESCALDACGFEFVRDVRPGEVVVLENGHVAREGLFFEGKPPHAGLCIFEYVYFARSDSVIDSLSVYEARYNMGMALADAFPTDADCVCGVPDSGLEAAAGYSARSGIPLVTGFVKNRYIGRSFIYPTQTERDAAVRLKLNPLAFNIRGKRIVLVDDSIVRGTTSEKIVRSLKRAGVKEVHMRISSPPFLHTCHYGTDIGAEENLIASRLPLHEICAMIGADSLGYIDIQNLKRACGKCALPFCTACFTGGEE